MSVPGVTYFPTPEDGETIYSICARFHRRSGHRSPRVTSQLLLGCSTGHLYSAVPIGLAQLHAASFGMIHADQETLRERTVLAAYLPFLDFARRSDLLKACKQSINLSRAIACSGLGRYTQALRLLKCCTACAAQHIREHGLPMWLASHQVPGVWLCEEHQRPLGFQIRSTRDEDGWQLPHVSSQQFVPRFNIEAGLKVFRVGSVARWLTTKSALEPLVLQVMLKQRLRLAGYSRSELRLLSVEEDHIDGLCRSHYGGINTPDIEHFQAGSWLKTLLADARHYNPLSWALALAFCGSVSRQDLDEEYDSAFSRKPQPELFDYLPRSRRTRAPDCLYAAFEHARLKADVILRCGLDRFEVDGWLRRDSDLKPHWKAMLRRNACEDAVAELSSFLVANPGARRVDLLRKCTAAYRWLEVNDHRLLQDLLPAGDPRFVKQLSLDL